MRSELRFGQTGPGGNSVQRTRSVGGHDDEMFAARAEYAQDAEAMCLTPAVHRFLQRFRHVRQTSFRGSRVTRTRQPFISLMRCRAQRRSIGRSDYGVLVTLFPLIHTDSIER